MNIYHQTGQGHHSTITCYQVRQSVQKISINSSIEELLFECRNQSDSIFLLDESYFDLVAYPIAGSFYEPISIHTIDALVANTVKKIKRTQKLAGTLLLYDVDHIIVDNEKTTYILGKTGYVQFQLSLILLKPSLVNICPSLLHKDYGPKVYPASYFSLQFIVHSLERENFALISISDDNARLMTISHGWYHRIESIDRGYSHIKQICAKHNILSFFYKSDDELESNPIAYSIMKKIMDFYNKMLVEWVASLSSEHPDSIVIAPQLKHHVFWESFNDYYKRHITGYVVPFSITDSLDHYGKKRQAHELDVLTCLNLFDTKKLVG